MSFKWHPKEDEILKKMAQGGMLMEQILSVLTARNEEAIRKRLPRLGLKLALKDPEIDIEAFNKYMGKAK